MTGAYSVHTIYEGHEIMFHVSTLLPYSKDNKQQVSDDVFFPFSFFFFFFSRSCSFLFPSSWLTSSSIDVTGSVHLFCAALVFFSYLFVCLFGFLEKKTQLERKRHIGNDIVNIVFMDGTAEEMSSFSPNGIKSQFTRRSFTSP